MRFFKLTSLVLSTCVALAAQAEQRLQPLVDRGDLLGWEAIGRLDVSGMGYCTAALIAPDLVLTAAHCVVDDNNEAIDARNITFRAGYVDGEALAERQVALFVADPEYRGEPGGRISLEMMPHDVALLKLAEPILSDVADPFVVHSEPQQGDLVSVLSYGRGRSEHLSWQRDCAVQMRYQDILMFDCDTTSGSSGAPVFVRNGRRMRILSLVSGGSRNSAGQSQTFGMELPAAVARLKQQLRVNGTGAAQASQGIKRIQLGNRATTGAKFVRSAGG